jgi:peptide/nickel transport system substrate-binding protein
MHKTMIACAAMLALASGCSRIGENGTPQSQARAAWTVPGVARVAVQTEPLSLNPALARDVTEVDIEGAVFDGLVKFDDKRELIPDLAIAVPSLANGGIARDGVTLTYHLRPHVLWQDGVPLTSADVLFTYRTLLSNGINSPYTGFYRTYINSVTAPDAHTVVVRLAHPYAAALNRVFTAASDGLILPQHILSRTRDISTDPFNVLPVGSGPFRVVRWDHGSTIVLRAFDRFFGGAPHLREIDVLIVPNQNTLNAMLGDHELDVAGVIPAEYSNVKKLDGYRVELVPSTTLRLLSFNLAHPPYDDVALRRALVMALDRPAITDHTSIGIGLPATSLIPPDNWAYTPADGALQYDPARARALLRADGWMPGADGIFAKNGRRLEFTLVTYAGTSADQGLPDVLQARWRAIGADVSIRFVPISVMYGEPGIAADGNFDVSLDGFVFDEDPDRANYLEPRFDRPHGGNQARYDDPEVTAWSEAALREYDRSSRARLYALIATRVNRDVPYVPLHWQRFVYVVNAGLRGFKPEPVESDFWNVQEWSD